MKKTIYVTRQDKKNDHLVIQKYGSTILVVYEGKLENCKKIRQAYLQTGEYFDEKSPFLSHRLL